MAKLGLSHGINEWDYLITVFEKCCRWNQWNVNNLGETEKALGLVEESVMVTISGSAFRRFRQVRVFILWFPPHSLRSWRVENRCPFLSLSKLTWLEYNVKYVHLCLVFPDFYQSHVMSYFSCSSFMYTQAYTTCKEAIVISKCRNNHSEKWY